MTDTVQDGTLRTRRALLTAAAGGAAALAVSAIKPAGVSAAPANMQTETDNATIAPTGVTNSATGTTALFGNAATDGRGVVGTSVAGPGVYGVSPDTSDPENNTANAGVVGVAGNEEDVSTNYGLTGVYGYADASAVEGFIGAGVWGDSADWGVVGSGSGGVLGDGVLGVYGFTGFTDGFGVLAEASEPSAIALGVAGKATFSRSGRTTVNSGSKKKVVNLAGATANSLVFAVLAQNRDGRYVRAAVPESGKFTIYLNAKVANDTKVSWIVFTNPNTLTG